MSERKLATIQKIRDIRPIEGADMIEVATINNWNVVVAKEVGHKIGDMVVYCEVDSFLPIRPEFEFLRKSSYKKMGDEEGFRLKTIKLRGQVSQGLILPIRIFLEYKSKDEIPEFIIGTDVSEYLGIKKYDPPIPAELAGIAKGNFPSFLRKTDEERIQNLTDEYENYKKMDTKWYVTEKLDGSSSTNYFHEGVLGVCSRNLDLEPSDTNTFWKTLYNLGVDEILKDYVIDIALQGELIGEGIQGNPYKFKGQTIRFFNLFDVEKQEWASYSSFKRWMSIAGLETVPIIDEDFTLPDTIEELIDMADGMSVLNPQTRREGLVIRSHDRKVSFKVISNKFLLKQK